MSTQHFHIELSTRDQRQKNAQKSSQQSLQFLLNVLFIYYMMSVGFFSVPFKTRVRKGKDLYCHFKIKIIQQINRFGRRVDQSRCNDSRCYTKDQPD